MACLQHCLYMPQLGLHEARMHIVLVLSNRGPNDLIKQKMYKA